MTEPVKVLPMAKLLRLAREKEERERAERESDTLNEVVPVGESSINPSIPQQTIPCETIVEPTITQQTIVHKTIPRQISVEDITSVNAEANYLSEYTEDKAKVSSEAKSKRKDKKVSSTRETIVRKTIVNEAKGYYPVYNDISDRIIPELQLNPYEQSVFQRLYRLSRGWKSDECEVGLGTLAKHCVMSRSQVQRSIAKLIEKGLIENLGSTKKGGKEGNRYRVLPSSIVSLRQTILSETIVSETMPDETIVGQGETSTGENTVVNQGIVIGGTNKNNDKDLLNTHTQTGVGVGVGSKFSLEECKRFAEHLQKTGQGINNPGGYATTIFRSGEADPQIEVFLKPPATVESDGCPDCGGSGYYYPDGVEKGVKICKHEKLKGTAKR
jgi:predicted transcriptional regulator